MDDDHYIPPTVRESSRHKQDQQSTDPSIAHSFEVRDERLGYAENEIRRLLDCYNKLREDLLPIFRMAKESKPLPTPDLMSPHHPAVLQPTLSSNTASGTPGGPGGMSYMKDAQQSPTISSSLASASAASTTGTGPGTIPTTTTSPPPTAGGSGAGTYSHLPTPRDNSAFSTTGNSASGSNTAPSPGVKKVISKASLSNLPLGSRSPTTEYDYKRDRDRERERERERERDREREKEKSGSNPSNTSNIGGGNSSSGGSSSSATSIFNSQSPSEPFKSFRVTMDDPCYKVLPAALRKYKIPGDWREYALLVCYGDQERLLGLEEKPLIIYKELQDAGKKPVFMLRHIEGSKNKHDHHHQQQGVVVSGTPGGVL